jgi:hypothetical protein
MSTSPAGTTVNTAAPTRPRLRKVPTQFLPGCHRAVAGLGHFERLFCHVFLGGKASRQRAFLSNLPNLFLGSFGKIEQSLVRD